VRGAALINISSMIVNPLFAQDVVVTRSAGHFAIGGWVEDTPSSYTYRGVILPTTSRDIEQVPEGDRVTESMTFYTRERLYVTRGGDDEGISDIITYLGSDYKLIKVIDYTAFGYNKAIGVRLAGD